MSEAQNATEQARQRVLDGIASGEMFVIAIALRDAGPNANGDTFVRDSLRANGYSVNGVRAAEALPARSEADDRYWAQFSAPAVGTPYPTVVVPSPYPLVDTDGRVVGFSGRPVAPVKIAKAVPQADPVFDAVLANLTPFVGRTVTEADVTQLAHRISVDAAVPSLASIRFDPAALTEDERGQLLLAGWNGRGPVRAGEDPDESDDDPQPLIVSPA